VINAGVEHGLPCPWTCAYSRSDRLTKVLWFLVLILGQVGLNEPPHLALERVTIVAQRKLDLDAVSLNSSSTISWSASTRASRLVSYTT
jgi:hypothetical protein